MKILIYSPVRLFAEGVAACLERGFGDEVCACVRFAALLGQAADFAPQAILVDACDARVFTAGKALAGAAEGAALIALALPEEPEQVIACADAGFDSYIPRTAAAAEMRAIIERALGAELVCDPKVSAALLHELGRRAAAASAAPLQPAPEATLSAREGDIAQLVSRGQSNKEIARRLAISPATVKNHVHNILTKLNLRTRGELAARLHDNDGLLAFRAPSRRHGYS